MASVAACTGRALLVAHKGRARSLTLITRSALAREVVIREGEASAGWSENGVRAVWRYDIAIAMVLLVTVCPRTVHSLSQTWRVHILTSSMLWRGRVWEFQ